MSRRRSQALLAGRLAAVVLIATDVTLALKRLMPDSVAANFIGPFLSVIGVMLMMRVVKLS